MADYKATVQKKEGEDADLDAEEKRVAALEAELAAAEARVEAADARYKLFSKQVAEELAKPVDGQSDAKKKSGGYPPTKEPGLAEVEAKLPSDDIGPDAVSKGAKNTSARTDKEVSRDRWLANRAAEGKVRNQAKKAREKLRKYQRDKKGEFAQVGDLAEDSPTPTPTKPAVQEQEQKERTPLFESDEVKQGAKSLSERLACLKDRPNAAEKKAAALKVLCGGRENYFSSEPSDVLADLEKRGLVEASLATELQGLLKNEAAKGAPIPPEEWLSHAQKVSGAERKDDEPIKDAEVQYLKWVDRSGFVAAEAELDLAEHKLEELLRHVDACLPVDDEEKVSETKKVSAEQGIDEDYADQLQEQYDAERQSKGMKNTSALPEKVVSKEKWLKDRGSENREFEKNIKAREARRGEARDSKTASADVGDD